MATIGSKSPLNFDHYGTYKNLDEKMANFGKISHLAKDIFIKANALFTASLITSLSMWITSSIMITPLISTATLLPVVLGSTVATIMTAILALVFFAGEEISHHYIKKQLPPLPHTQPEQLFEYPLEEMIKHAYASPEVIQKIEDLRPAYQATKKTYVEEIKLYEYLKDLATSNHDDQLKTFEAQYRQDLQNLKNQLQNNKITTVEYDEQLTSLKLQLKDQIHNQQTSYEKKSETHTEAFNRIQTHFVETIKKLHTEVVDSFYQDFEEKLKPTFVNSNKDETFKSYLQTERVKLDQSLAAKKEYYEKGFPSFFDELSTQPSSDSSTFARDIAQSGLAGIFYLSKAG